MKVYKRDQKKRKGCYFNKNEDNKKILKCLNRVKKNKREKKKCRDN